MKYRRVGRSGLKISEIALGSWLTYGGTVEDGRAKECMSAAIEHGINFIDTAEIYAKGRAEEVIGQFLREESIDRSRIVVSSKLFWPMTDDINHWGLSRKNIMRAIDGSLERLGLDYLDIYFMHRFDHTTPLEETVLAIDDLIHEGRVLHWGTSTWTAAQLERVSAVAREVGAHRPIVEQPMYNMLGRYIELEIIPVASRLGMGFTVWSPLAQGLLTGKYNQGIPEESRGSRSESIKRQLTPEMIEKLKRLGELASTLDITTGQLALAWILRRPEISAAIVGATRPEHVAENAAASDVRLSPDVLDQIESILGNAPQWPATYEPNVFYEDRMGA
ncbi:MAG: aldo/keto reductase family protein [Candidatus Thorarchaeota archaeon]|nr:aldo/keto reductase family protein [Candidatus Thorarchaeota archaeon]